MMMMMMMIIIIIIIIKNDLYRSYLSQAETLDVLTEVFMFFLWPLGRIPL
jgi:hypothetical protein